jgi:hypothetical protein
MPKIKHTRGPWDVWFPGRLFVVPRGNFTSICELTELEGERTKEAAKANGRIIASSVTLYTLCKELDIEMDGVKCPATAAAILNAIRSEIERIESEDE